MAKQDYYDVLGVAKDADDASLKKAYRRLAMKYHPDRNEGDKEAEEKFKEAKDAYEVLKDPAKRASYDQFGTADFQQGQRRRGPGPNVEEILRRTASAFHGMGGFGAVNVNITPDGIEQKIGVPVDVMMRGGTFSFTYVVPVSRDATAMNFKHSMGTMDIPADTAVGHRVTKEEFGQKIALILVPESSKSMMCQGMDVIAQADVDILRALAGEKIEVSHPGGTTLKVKPPSNVKQGMLVRIAKKGLRATNGLRGDFFVSMNLVVPTITDDQRRKLKDLLKG